MNNVRISLIAAISRDNVIGINNRIPWICRCESGFFKKITQRQRCILYNDACRAFKIVDLSKNSSNVPVVIMGRKTYESMNLTMLSGRKNIVLSKNLKNLTLVYNGNDTSTVHYASTLDDAIKVSKEYSKHIFIIGGHDVYKECLDRGLCSEIIISRLKFDVLPNIRITDKIVKFPDIDLSIYEKVATIPFNNCFDIEIYNWTLEQCQSLIHENNRDLLRKKNEN